MILKVKPDDLCDPNLCIITDDVICSPWDTYLINKVNIKGGRLKKDLKRLSEIISNKIEEVSDVLENIKTEADEVMNFSDQKKLNETL